MVDVIKKMLSFTLCSENLKGRILAKFTSPFLVTDDDKERVYVMCDIESPIRRFEFKSRSEPSYITCHITYNGIVIICNPVSEQLLLEKIYENDDTKAKKIVLSGFPVNAKHPTNLTRIEVSLYLTKERQIPIIAVERAEFSLGRENSEQVLIQSVE